MAAGIKTGGRKAGTPNKPRAARAAGTLPPPADGPALPPYRLARVDQLVPYARNARTHSPEQIAKLAAMITEYGWTNPVLVDGRNGIVAGHGRVLAAQSLGMDVVPTIELAHLTAAQRRAYVIADNRSALDAGWDDDLLRLELGELREDGFDLGLTGFDAGELDTLFGEEVTAPDAFGAYDETIETEHQCPKCGYRFSGGSLAAAESAPDAAAE